MESEIQTTLPEGSPILAYGESHQPPTKTILALLAGVLVTLGVAFLLWVGFGWKIHLPNNTIVLAAVHGKSDLPSSFPQLWRDAVSQTSHPLILGLAHQGDAWIPYVVGGRFDVRVGSVINTDGAFRIQSNDKLNRSNTETVRSLLSLANDASGHKAALSIRADQEMITGYIDDNVWKTETALDQPKNPIHAQDVSADLTALPGTWAAISPLLTPYPLPLSITEQPISLTWIIGKQGGENAFDLDFASVPSTSTQKILEAAQAAYQHQSYVLPDNTQEDELLLPKLGNTQSTSTSSTETMANNTQTHIHLGPRSDRPPEASPTCDQGTPALRLSPQALNLIIERTNLPFAPVSKGLTVVEREGRMHLCLE